MKDVSHRAKKCACATTQSPLFPFFGMHVKPQVVWYLIHKYDNPLDPKLGHGKCVKYDRYLVHMWHVPTFCTRYGPLVWTTPKNPSIDLLLTSHNELW